MSTISPGRFDALASRYPSLRVALVGDFCLDRYLEIDPARTEMSIETNLPVYNVVKVRPQPGGAGTILNNLVALGIGTIYPVGFAGQDGEGFELVRGLRQLGGVRMDHFIQTSLRHTFTYCKPLLVSPGKPPAELNRLDTKNWTPTPQAVQEQLANGLGQLAAAVDAIIVLDQVEIPETGVVTGHLLKTLEVVTKQHPKLVILADSRRSLRGFPSVAFKMNEAELCRMTGCQPGLSLDEMETQARGLAQQNMRPVFVTAAERGITGALPTGETARAAALPLRGEIDIVGAGDAVSANLASSFAAGASLSETLQIASAAASVVIHKLGTTGTASVAEIRELL